MVLQLKPLFATKVRTKSVTYYIVRLIQIMISYNMMIALIGAVFSPDFLKRFEEASLNDRPLVL